MRESDEESVASEPAVSPSTSVPDAYDDEEWDDAGGPGGGAGRRDLTIVFGVIAVVLAVALVIVATKDDPTGSDPGSPGTPTSGSKAKDTLCGNWPSALGGDGRNVASSPGVYIWSDFGGVHVRSNDGEPVKVTVVGNEEFTVTKAGEGVQASADRGTEVAFDLPAGDGAHGPDLNVACRTTSLTFEVARAGANVPPETIKIGGSAVAGANPAQFARDAG